MIYDCIPFFNELDILKLRLNIMAPYVDKFVLEEATVTFSGEPKPMTFAEHRDMFAEFLDRIIYVAVDDSPLEGITTHERDKFQKNKLMNALINDGAKEDDIILLSDVDEIPNVDILEDVFGRLRSEEDADKIFHFAQRMFYCFLNMEEVSGNLLSITGEFPGVDRRMWLGTKACRFSSVPKDGMIMLREVSPEDARSVRISNGGWHFGYMGGDGERDVAKRIGTKVKAAAHQEYNSARFLTEAVDRLLCGEDIFGRDAEFVRAEIDESYPKYLREHLADYDFLIAPKVSAFGLVVKKCRFKIDNALRVLHGKLVNH